MQNATSEPLTVRYTNSMQNEKVLLSFFLLRRAAPKLVLGALAFMGIGAVFGSTSTGAIPGALSGLLALVLLLVFFTRVWFQQTHQFGRLGSRQIEISPKGVLIGGETRSNSLDWPAVREVAATPQHVFILMKLDRSEAIPRSAFTSPAEAADFIDAARRWHSAAGT
jgi:hypothetical protein